MAGNWNSPFLDRTGWEKSVKKMVHVMGAPIPEQDLTKKFRFVTPCFGSYHIGFADQGATDII
ncbi:MAG: hypothetical protein ACREV4_15830 [Gammaproteobacteria bacterium]